MAAALVRLHKSMTSSARHRALSVSRRCRTQRRRMRLRSLSCAHSSRSRHTNATAMLCPLMHQNIGKSMSSASCALWPPFCEGRSSQWRGGCGLRTQLRLPVTSNRGEPFQRPASKRWPGMNSTWLLCKPSTLRHCKLSSSSSGMSCRSWSRHMSNGWRELRAEQQHLQTAISRRPDC